MSDEGQQPTAPDAAVAQSREPEVEATAAPPPPAGDMVVWTPGRNLKRADRIAPYRRKKNDPLYRPLQIFTLDPAQSRLKGAVTTVPVPFEPLALGPVGSLIEIDIDDASARVNLDESNLLLTDGVTPSPANPKFHGQMVYAVTSSVYNAFKVALGRDLSWGFRRARPKPEKLRLRPFSFEGQNAFYDPENGTIEFGSFPTPESAIGRNVPNGIIYTALSHDIIAHEVSHALLDGLRTAFTVPSNSDVLALHEAFADLVAILQHFSYPELVLAAVRESKGDLREQTMLSKIAHQFGESKGVPSLRTAIDFVAGVPHRTYDNTSEPHERGAVLVAALFDAFTTVYWRKVERLLRIATGRTGVPPVGELTHDLQVELANAASRLSSQFLALCIRAVDYCPPVDVTFGDYLRALITADSDLVPSDPWAYREAIVDAFRIRRIFPSDVRFLSEDEIRWKPPVRNVDVIPELSFEQLRFRGDPGQPMSEQEVSRQATALASFVCNKQHLEMFGLAAPGEHEGDVVEPPVIESIRSSRRIGPDEQIVFDLVAEVVQVRWAKLDDGRTFPFRGGATIVTGPDGDLRYAVVKNILSPTRLARQRAYMTSKQGAPYWLDGESLTPDPAMFRLLHDHDPTAEKPGL